MVDDSEPHKPTTNFGEEINPSQGYLTDPSIVIQQFWEITHNNFVET